jgi:DNA-binding NarL/FixJ family response regulator
VRAASAAANILRALGPALETTEPWVVRKRGGLRVPGAQAGANGSRNGDEPSVAVVVADDHELFRDVLRDVVRATPGMTLVGEAESGEAALDAVEALVPQLVIMDNRMPGIGGIEAARRIHARHPQIAVVLVSVDTPEDRRLLDGSHAVAFLPKRQISPRALSELWRKLASQ